jgi:calcineurin-like phosphoesterase
MTTLLFIGDIVGRPGRELVRRAIPVLVSHHQVDLVIANVENAAAGFGVTPDIADDFISHGVQVMTGGNHTWDKKEIVPYFADQPCLLRPANMPAGTPGRGAFRRARHKRSRGRGHQRDGPRVHDGDRRSVSGRDGRDRGRQDRAKVIFVDFHAEATSEKVAMGWYLDGKVTAVVGTHTHVQTADERVLPQGTAYITDVGMTGPHDSVIGVERGRSSSGSLPGCRSGSRRPLRIPV